MKPSLFVIVSAIALALTCPVTSSAQEGGNPIKVTTLLHGDGTRTDTTRDLDAHTSETKTYDASNKLIQRAVFSLDEEGREVAGTIYNAKGVVVGQVNYEYDIFGRVKQQFEKAPNGALVRRLVFHRDTNGRVMSIDAFDAQGNPIKGDSSSSSSPRKGRSGGR